LRSFVLQTVKLWSGRRQAVDSIGYGFTVSQFLKTFLLGRHDGWIAAGGIAGDGDGDALHGF
jgi:hypothetical protein